MAKRGRPKGSGKTKLSDLKPMRQILDALKVWGCLTLQDPHWSIFTKESKFGADDGKRLRTHVNFLAVGKILHVHGDAAVADTLAGLVKNVFVEAHELQPDLDPLTSLKGTLEAWDVSYGPSLETGMCQAVWGVRVGSGGHVLRLPAPFSECGLEMMHPVARREAIGDFLAQLFRELQPIAVGL